MTRNLLWDRGGDLPVQLVTSDPLPISCRESCELYRPLRHAFPIVLLSIAACALILRRAYNSVELVVAS